MDDKWFWVAMIVIALGGMTPMIIKEWRGGGGSSKVDEYRRCLRIDGATEQTCREILGLDAASNNR
jgi:hypothetical protein